MKGKIHIFEGLRHLNRFEVVATLCGRWVDKLRAHTNEEAYRNHYDEEMYCGTCTRMAQSFEWDGAWMTGIKKNP